MPRCSHCLIEFSEATAERDQEGRLFCCMGCMEVYHFINDEGLGAFYTKRKWEASGLPQAGLTEMDEGPFLEHVREAESGESDIDIYLDGIRCASCVWLVERVLRKTPGVLYARVNYATHRCRIKWDMKTVPLKGLLVRIRHAGYTPKPYAEDEAARMRAFETRELLIRFGTAAFLSSQLMIYSIALYAGYFQGMEASTRGTLEWISMGLTTPVIFYSGMPLIMSAIRCLGRFRFNMDFLIVTGSLSAFSYSIYSLLRGGEVYFDTAAMIITLILLGRFIESSAKGRAAETIDRLAVLIPRNATVVTTGEGGVVLERRLIPVSSLLAGTQIEVKPGEQFPADGVVVGGASEADESAITGEFRRISKTVGATITGGAQNLYGALVVRVTRAGKDTVLSGIIRAVEDAQAAKPRIQGLADRVVGVFVPLVIITALATFAWHWFYGAPLEAALMTSISVLVIACPCSLGLATPLAVLVYTGMASSRGLLIKRGEAAEQASRITHVVFDKTGTITTGSPALKSVLLSSSGLTRTEALGRAASLEALSEHSLAKAISNAAKAEAASLPSLHIAGGFLALPGKGVTGSIDGAPTLIGSRALMEEAGINMAMDSALEAEIAGGLSRGGTAVYMCSGGRLQAVFIIADTMRREAPIAVAELKTLGCTVSLISGDNPQTTSSVALAAGMDDYIAGALPVEKREQVRRMQASRMRDTVLMAGDGINDAPALTEASVGVAMGRGTEIAMESADVVMMRDDLMLLPYFVRLSRLAFRVIKQNIFWSFFYNIAAVPFAVAGMLHPIVAAAAMAASSLVVVGNSLRIRNIKPCGP